MNIWYLKIKFTDTSNCYYESDKPKITVERFIGTKQEVDAKIIALDMGTTYLLSPEYTLKEFKVGHTLLKEIFKDYGTN